MVVFNFLNLRKANDSKGFQRSLSICLSCTKKALNNLLIFKALQRFKVVPHVPIYCIVMWSVVE